ncbi:16S rRNA (guanine(1516)-N(2))-methyltransferase [Gilliamella sp. Nev5-1]|nr:class I SAM-dependent methyltransferase [Gilliamella apicola]OCG59332.1 16S rRNA (guanine(1516)-N(2))-methyltransferase [Gilliamella apicola]OCG67533.1 16S rRNA (guanine(1516)-N(2))-methyltransferase [Gilliamella apicola]OCG70191.1 16S rRNA (guanine(1516)-N(2))-methyltransferase [Gilliamella apicola]
MVSSSSNLAQLIQLAEQWLLAHADLPFTLVNQNNRLELQKTDEPKLGSICVNFVSGAMAHRRQFGGGRGEAIAKAVGVKGEYLPTVIDATAGLGRDAFVLASIGCHVTMFERHPVVAALLSDGLQRAYQDLDIGHWIEQQLHLIYDSSIEGLRAYPEKPDVVYLDPMFPHRQKSALVKKEMRIFQQLVGSDSDADSLLTPARQLARKRVVVKRPDYAPFLANQKPTAEIKTKNHRFDIYTPLK